jgi:DNA-binding beta-propeller fold protein YncE
VLGWDYHVHQRAHGWPDINRRKDDLKKLYSTDNKQVAAEILKKYHIALVYVGQLERRTYNGANLEHFKEWSDLLQPVYSNAGVTVFAVQGQFVGAIPMMTIEQVPQVAENEEVVVQGSPGQLSQPRGLALDAEGNIYVADFGNDRVQKFNPQREFIKEWGEKGDLPNQFKQPGDIAIGPDGMVYVADTWNQRVQVFTPDGEYKREWTDRWYGPRGIAVAPDGRVYLADTGNHKIRRFTKDGVEELTWGSLGKEPTQFTEPVGVAVDAKGLVYVVDNGNARLQIFDADGQLKSSIAVEGWQQKVFSEPHVAVAPDGTIWVTVPVLQVVRAYDHSGTLLKEIKGGDEPDLPFERAMGIAYDQKRDELVIADLGNRIVRLPAK